MLRKTNDGETVSPSTTFTNGNAKVTFVVSASEKKGAKGEIIRHMIPEHVGETTFDFSGVSPEAIKQLAVDTLTIKLQSQCRTAYNSKELKGKGAADRTAAMAAKVPATIKVADFITTRARVDKVEKGKELLKGMTPEQRKELAKALAAMK